MFEALGARFAVAFGDRHSLTALERGVFRGVCEQNHHNLVFICLRHSLQEMMKTRYDKLSSFTNVRVLRRKYKPRSRTVELEECPLFVSQITLPMTTSTALSFPITLTGGWDGWASFLQGAFLRRMTLGPVWPEDIADGILNAEGVSLLPVQLADERTFWRERVMLLPKTLLRLGNIVVRTVEEGAWGKDVVVPSYSGYSFHDNDRFTPCETLRQFFGVTNGLTVNRLFVRPWSIVTKHTAREHQRKEYVFTFVEKHTQEFLLLGTRNQDNFFLPVDGNRVLDEVHRFRAGHSKDLKQTGMTVADLCIRSLAGESDKEV